MLPKNARLTLFPASHGSQKFLPKGVFGNCDPWHPSRYQKRRPAHKKVQSLLQHIERNHPRDLATHIKARRFCRRARGRRDK